MKPDALDSFAGRVTFQPLGQYLREEQMLLFLYFYFCITSEPWACLCQVLNKHSVGDIPCPEGLAA